MMPRAGRRCCGWSATARARATSRVTRRRRAGSPHRHRRPRRRRAAVAARRAAGGRARPMVRARARRTAAPRSCWPRLTCARCRRPSLFREAGGCQRDGAICMRRAAAREGVRHPRPPDHAGHHRAPSRAGRVPPHPRQILPPSARRRELVRRDLPAALADRHGALHYAGQRVMIVAHQVVVLCMRYIIENLDEARSWRSTARATWPTARSPNIASIRRRAARRARPRPLQRHRADGGGAARGDERARPAGGGARMSEPIPLDAAWLARTAARHGDGTDKKAAAACCGRRVPTVPGALRLTAEAAFRAGAGKVQIATIGEAALALGMGMPEAAVWRCPRRDGEIAWRGSRPARSDRRVRLHDAGTRDRRPRRAAELLAAVLGEPRTASSVVLDAAAIAWAGELRRTCSAHGGRVVLTPHHGEMAACTGATARRSRRSAGVACEAARRFGAVVVLKAVDPDRRARRRAAALSRRRHRPGHRRIGRRARGDHRRAAVARRRAAGRGRLGRVAARRGGAAAGRADRPDRLPRARTAARNTAADAPARRLTPILDWQRRV